MIIRTARLLLRSFLPGDAPAMESIFCDPEVMRFSDHGPRSRAFVGSWIAAQIADSGRSGGFGCRAVIERATDECTGYMALAREPERCGPDEAEIGFRLARRYWGRGYATEAARVTVEYGFSTLDIRRIIAIADPHNRASLRVIEKLGMRYVREISFPGYNYPDRLYALTNPRATGIG